MGDRVRSDAIARIVERATELHGSGSDTGIDDDALLQAADEVGLDREAMRKSIAVERVGGDVAHGRVDRLFGNALVIVDRYVDLEPLVVLDRLDSWLVSGHHLRREQLSANEGWWTKRSDLAASVQRTMRGISGSAALGEERSVQARVARVIGHRTLVRVTVERSKVSRGVAVGATAAGGTGVVGAAVGAVMLTPVLAVLAPVGVLGAAAMSVGNKRAVQRTHRELERLLASVERGEEPPSLTETLRTRSR